MTQLNTVIVDFHEKRYSDFDLIRIARAVGQCYQPLVTAYVLNVHFQMGNAVGVVFGHINSGPYGRFADGHLICISEIQSVEKEGRFWVITTLNSRYVVVTFSRDCGRRSLREFHSQTKDRSPPPDRLH